MRILLLLLFSISSFANDIDFKAHFFINGKAVHHGKHVMVKPNVPTLIEVFFTHPETKKIYKEFKMMHGKIMHMVIVSKDLSVFKHVHPYFDPATGRFSLTVNMPYADPDNKDAAATLSAPGMYMIMADVIIKGVGMRMGHSMAMVMGEHSHHHLHLDHRQSDGTITKFFKRNSSDEEETYKAVFRKHSIPGCQGRIVSFEIEMFAKSNGVFTPLMDIEPWLGEAAHSVWISNRFMMPKLMPFAHMHSPFVLEDEEEAGPRPRVDDHIFRFNFHDKNVMLPGLQKMWIQFKHMGKVIKMPFVFDYDPIAQRDC